MAEEEVGSLGVKLSIDSTNFTRPLASVERNLKSLGGELATIRNKGADWGKSLEGLGQKQEVLGRTLSTQEAKVKSLREAYEKSVREKGKDAAATENLAAKLNRAVSEYTRTETELNQVNSALAEQRAEIARAESAWGRLETSLDSASNKLSAAGEISRDIGGKLTVGLTTPLLGAGAAALKLANDFDTSQGKLQAQLGLTAEEAEKLHGTAENLWKNAFGESIGGVAEDLALIKQNMHGITGDQLESVAEKAYILQDAFGAEMISTTKTAQTMMTNFGITADEAFDLMTRGFQEGGNYSDELLDTLNEYSPQFATMGHSAKDMMNILIAGAEAGAFNLDKVGDAVKEFNIRAKDGSKTTAEGFKAIGLNAEDMGSAIAQGGEAGTKAFQATIAALAAMEDPVEQTAAGVALFGTQWEDLESGVVEAMGSTLDQLGEVEGATKAAGDALYDNLGSRATSVFRDFQSDLEPAGEILVDLAEDYLPKIADAIGEVTGKFADMSPEAQENAIMIGGIAAAAGPAAIAVGTISSGIGTLVKAGGGLVSMLGKAGGSGLLGRLGLMGAATGPVGLAVAGVGALGLGIHALNEASEESKEVNLDHAESLIEQQQSLDGLIGKYEVLAGKNLLSNDELLRFRDIQDELDTATSAKEVEALAAEAGELQKNSGMTNKELRDMLKLNDELIEKVPEVGQKFTDQGNAIITNADGLHIANEELRDAIQLELELQQVKAEAKIGEDLQKRAEAIKDFNKTAQDYNNELLTQWAREDQAAKLRITQQEAYAAGQDEIAIGMESDIMTLTDQARLHEQNAALLATEVQEKRKSVAKSDEQLTKTQQLSNEFINLQLASAGVNAKGAEGIAQLDSATAKVAQRVGQLNLAKQSQGGLNAAQQTELDSLNTKLGVYRTTKSEIQNIQSEQGAVNQRIEEGKAKAQEMSQTLDKDEQKNIKFGGDGLREAQIISVEAGKDVQKAVEVTDFGKTNSIHNDAEKDAHKSVYVKVIQTVSSVIKGIGNVAKDIFGYAHGTENPTRISAGSLSISPINSGRSLNVGTLKYASATEFHPEGFKMVGEEL